MLDACMLGGTVIADRTLRRFAHFLEASEISGHQVSEHSCVAGSGGHTTHMLYANCRSSRPIG